ncbi:MAG TPA: 16S rRNA (guanine(966)-N(2))-methyltransferase RsmD [Thermodesulfovibrionales bacterium]|jgi:16S rRNA (guanine(966)-N(2))-methyltransferase RsmD|nr:16S rRNA (guanine(966)-N(2))-methyltransferase RsmD [Thermodesulfovibrionales bacterium]
MRISGGSAKGRKVGARKAFSRKTGDDELRPTSSKVREAIGDILQSNLTGSSFLDLYAGTGAVGIEALSRGAGRVVFVESNDLRVKLIRELISEFHFEARSRVTKAKAYDFVEKTPRDHGGYDIVFLDPPYSSEELMKILPLIGEGGIVKDKGLVLVEHFFKRSLPDIINGLHLLKVYRYGDTSLSLYQKVKT